MIPEQLTQPPICLWGPASPKNDFLYVATKVVAEQEVFLKVFVVEIIRNIWPKWITEVDWFEVIGCANQGPWGGRGERGLALTYRAGERERERGGYRRAHKNRRIHL